MKISYYLLISLVCWSGCKNYNGEKSAKTDTAIEKDQEELGELLFSETTTNKDSIIDNADTVKIEDKTSEIISSEINKQECEKCDRKKILIASQNMNDLNSKLIYDLLCTFDESCSSNIEYSEFSNEVLYKVLSKYPKEVVRVMSDSPELNSEYIYKELSSPLLDYDYNAIINSVKELEGNEEVKNHIIKSVEKAIDG